MGSTRISYTLTKLVLWAALFTVNVQQDRSTLGPASTTSKFLSIVLIVKEKDTLVRTGSKYLLKESWLYCMCYSTWIKHTMYNTIQMYTYYTHLNTLYITKYQRNSIHACTRIHYLLHGSIIKCSYLLKKKKVVRYYHLEWTSLYFLWRMLFQSFYWSNLNEAECGHVSKKDYPIK